jgi:hypothetical protein
MFTKPRSLPAPISNLQIKGPTPRNHPNTMQNTRQIPHRRISFHHSSLLIHRSLAAPAQNAVLCMGQPLQFPPRTPYSECQRNRDWRVRSRSDTVQEYKCNLKGFRVAYFMKAPWESRSNPAFILAATLCPTKSHRPKTSIERTDAFLRECGGLEADTESPLHSQYTLPFALELGTKNKESK